MQELNIKKNIPDSKWENQLENRFILKSSDILLFILYFYVARNILNEIIPLFNFFDEILGFVGLLLIVYRSKKVKNGFSFGCLLFILAGLISSYMCQFQPLISVTLPDMYLCIKFWLWVAVGVYCTTRDAESIYKKLLFHAKLITVLIFIATMLDSVFHIFNEMNDVKMGMRSVGLWDGPASLSSTAFTLLCILQYEYGNKNALVYKFMNLIILVLTLRYKSLAVVAVYVMISVFRTCGVKKLKKRHLVMLMIIAILVAQEQLNIYIETSEVNARSVLWINSVILAYMYAPLGTGFGTFASYFSGVNYSPVYSMLGIDSIFGLSEDNPNFVSDTFWPAIIGQTGLLGTIGYIIAILTLIRRFNHWRIKNKNIYFSGMLMLVYLLLTSISESAFLHWNAFMMAVLMGVIIKDSSKV